MSIIGNIIKGSATAVVLTGAAATIVAVAVVAHAAEATLTVYGAARDAIRATGAVPVSRHRDLA